MNENSIISAEDGDAVLIGRFGHAWQDFMREHCPNEADELQSGERWEQLAHEIDREAEELRQILRNQYAKANPRPTEFTELLTWENTRGSM